MQKYLLSFLLIGLLLFCFSQNRQSNDAAAQLQSYEASNKIYKQAENQSLKAGDNEQLQSKADETYQKALIGFASLIPAVEKTGNDSLLFFILLKRGFIHYYFDSINAAKKDYLGLIALKQKLQAIPDSFLFIPYLYTGSTYYTQNQFDSALFYYKKAEQLNDSYQKPLNESQRLYNRLGAMYYETGNYRQARNYFEKAIALTNPTDKNLLVNYKINIASLLIKLGEFDSAKVVYERLLPSPVFENEIYHNLGIISLKQQDYKKAIGYLRKVNYSDNKREIDLYYNFAVACSALNEKDSSGLYLQKAITENIKWNKHIKNTQYGLILKYQAEELTKQQLYKEAVAQYQQAVMQFYPSFNETDDRKNPEEYSGIFSYINLFNTLAAKGDALNSWYQQKNEIELLKSSLDAYQSAFKLADYVEKTYNSDEARLFLGKLKYTVHSKPIDVSLQLYTLTKKKQYLEEAYLFDQRNKASILSLTVQENEWKNGTGISNDLVRQESLLKSAITRLSLKIMQVTDSGQLNNINTSIRDKEIELSKLQEKINADPAWQQRKSVEQIPAITELQKRLDNTTALLSFHLSENELLILIVTANNFTYYKSVIPNNFFAAIDSFKSALQPAQAEQRYNGAIVAAHLYQTLIAPVQSNLSQIKRLIIIPDDELNYLPFEALQDDNKKYLVERFAIQYQYSTALLGKKETTLQTRGTLSFAPFASNGYNDSSGIFLRSLPASMQEVTGIRGTAFIDEQATKKKFLQSVNQYNIIHLATHASVNNNDPPRSYIAFYPGNNDYKLYANEIHNLKLDSTQLVILSACETGTGQLVKGEGLMSLSRAFAYAGCPNIITSLWKAEDKTTAFITQRLHYYLDKHYSKDRALQQAKLDLLNNTEIDPRFKSPVYWAHLIFIGNYEPDSYTSNWWWIAMSIFIGSIIYLLTKKRNLLAKRRQV